MNENVSNASSIKEVAFQIQESIISLIRANVESDYVRIWTPEERIFNDDELRKKYEIYIVENFFTYKKQAKKPLVETLLTKEDENTSIDLYNTIFIRLSNESAGRLKNWSRKAANVIRTYLEDRYSVFLRETNFFFLPDENKENFIVPNILLENLYVSTQKRSNDITSADFLAETTVDDEAIANSFAKMIRKNNA